MKKFGNAGSKSQGGRKVWERHGFSQRNGMSSEEHVEDIGEGGAD